MPPPDNQPIALWMVLFAFWASVLLTILKIGEILRAALRRPRLDLRLTPDVFFRLIDQGESLFCNSVLLAWNGPLVILSSTVELIKTDIPTKAFPLKVVQVGEKVKSSGPLAEHFFRSSSPISHVPESDPQRVLYLCVQEKYEERSRKLIQEFRKKVLDYKQELVGIAGAAAETKPEIRPEFVRRTTKIVDEMLSKMMDAVQLEPGEYKLTLRVQFRDPKSRIERGGASESSIRFSVGDDVREVFRTNLRQTLLVSATNLIFDYQAPVLYPDYAPTNVQTTDVNRKFI